MMPLTLTGLRRYVIKSCGGTDLSSAVVEPWGLAGDRRWMVVDPAGEPVTARERPRMVLVSACPAPDGGITVSAPGMARLHIPRPSAETEKVSVWGSAPMRAGSAGEAAAGWFSAVTGVPSRLVYLADPAQRHPSPQFADPADTVTFADAYPMLLTSQDSLADLNALIAGGPNAAEGPLVMARFRPSLVVTGAPPWAEDGWRRLRVGAATFRAVKGCDRCVLTTVNPQTAARGKEPIATLARHRKWDGATWFGMNLIPDTPGAVISTGDPVEVLDEAPAADGPPRYEHM
jgi:uncharacterized protein YcbX